MLGMIIFIISVYDMIITWSCTNSLCILCYKDRSI